MSLKQLPELCPVNTLSPSTGFDLRPQALERWSPMAALDVANSISIFDVIGESVDGQGVTARRISAALRSIGQKDIVVHVNSPGGNFFEGFAIYNLLRTHAAKVTVNVMGLAASAASVIAMAGDDIQMGAGSFLMIHNTSAFAMGNRHDFQDVANRLAPFDAAMATLYAERTGQSVDAITQLMDQETWFDGPDAVKRGFADGLLRDDALGRSAAAPSSHRKALACVEAALAKSGYSRSQRRDTLKTLFSSTPCAAQTQTTPSAGPVLTHQLNQLIATLTH